ncbi:hypothetical protein P171DRAFT_446906 [Karstenula rhodostoma CBS 690.94]|uniref:Uncharacterized protein n=1 Tax=Karstenula rhodostoma CBS 690.94 TaxID=1392251 RepID=A0A9P4PBW0_9PLEO|nr:hypothetical protein P171DRAFT_446906 [Karstenula rhodostoma CBS 690.94]
MLSDGCWSERKYRFAAIMSLAGSWLVWLSRSSANAVDGECGEAKMGRVSEEVLSRPLMSVGGYLSKRCNNNFNDIEKSRGAARIHCVEVVGSQRHAENSREGEQEMPYRSPSPEIRSAYTGDNVVATMSKLSERRPESKIRQGGAGSTLLDHCGSGLAAHSATASKDTRAGAPYRLR